jgi:hypothetical protein
MSPPTREQPQTMVMVAICVAVLLFGTPRLSAAQATLSTQYYSVTQKGSIPVTARRILNGRNVGAYQTCDNDVIAASDVQSVKPSLQKCQNTLAFVPVAGGNPSRGSQTFVTKCSVCDSTGPYDDKRIGPGVGALFADPNHPRLGSGSLVSQPAVKNVIVNGYVGKIGMMPSASVSRLSPSDVDDLVSYLEALSKR